MQNDYNNRNPVFISLIILAQRQSLIVPSLTSSSVTLQKELLLSCFQRRRAAVK